MAEGSSTFRLAATADLHCRADQHGKFRETIKNLLDEASGPTVSR